MLITPFKGTFPMTQDWNDPRYRSSYTKFGLLGHNGVDYGCPVGTPILSPHAGRVIEALNDTNGYGWYVKIENDKEGSILAHFKESPKVRAGDEVKQGQQVGLSGNTGNSTGPHLHWGYYRFPRKRDNGFSGTVDQVHWMNLEDADILLQELIEMRASRDKWKSDFKDLEKRHIVELADKDKHIDLMQSTLAEQNMQITSMNETMSKLTLENKSLREDSVALQASLVDMKASFEREMDTLQSALSKQMEITKELEEEVKKLKEKNKIGLEKYSVWELLKAILRR